MIEFVMAAERKEAEARCPWAQRVLRVKDGFLCFDTIETFQMHYESDGGLR